MLRRHYPASTLLRPCPIPAMAVACRDVEAATLAPDGSPPITRTTFPTCRAHYPGGSRGCVCRLLPRITQPSPNGRRVGIRIVTFEACSGFTHVTARRIAQPPIAAFVTRLQPFRLPGRAARQLPDQSTTLWVDSASTGDPRLRGALPSSDMERGNHTRAVSVALTHSHDGDRNLLRHERGVERHMLSIAQD